MICSTKIHWLIPSELWMAEVTTKMAEVIYTMRPETDEASPAGAAAIYTVNMKMHETPNSIMVFQENACAKAKTYEIVGEAQLDSNKSQ